MEKLTVGTVPVEVHICEGGDWTNDCVCIWNSHPGGIDSGRIDIIMQYLYDEGFIQDRRTRYDVLDKSGLD